MNTLAKKEREQIFNLFTEQQRLTFARIERATGMRSNLVAYHVRELAKDGLLRKDGEHYILTNRGESLIPVLSQITGDTQCALPVVLVAPIRQKRVFLVQRSKRPYRNYWSLVGGKMLFSETYTNCARRLLREKAGLFATSLSLNAVIHEHVEEDGVIKHSFLLFFVKAGVKRNTAQVARADKSGTIGRNVNECDAQEFACQDSAGWFTVQDMASMHVIPSDLWLLQHKLTDSVEIKHVTMQEKQGTLSGFLIE